MAIYFRLYDSKKKEKIVNTMKHLRFGSDINILQKAEQGNVYTGKQTGP
jgi:hypothetical protein